MPRTLMCLLANSWYSSPQVAIASSHGGQTYSADITNPMSRLFAQTNFALPR
jgi:hypothetical protein